MNDQIRALIFEVCNDWVSRGNLYTDDIHECFLNSTGDKGKYSFALDALAKMALAADQQPPQPERSAYHSQALADVIAERRRQIEVKGWTPEHDDMHSDGTMAKASACYVLVASGFNPNAVVTVWPWSQIWWKPTTPRRNMIKSVALGLAEIERMDRAKCSASAEREGV